ncbi:MAG: GumC family protein [Ruegeria sp.]
MAAPFNSAPNTPEIGSVLDEPDGLGQIIFRHLRMIAIVVLATMGLVFGISTQLQNRYEAKVITVMTPVVTKFRSDHLTLRHAGLSIAGMETEFEILKSRAFAAEIVDLMSLHDDQQFVGQFDPNDPMARLLAQERAIGKMQKSYTIRRMKRSMALEIRAIANSPQQAAEIANTVSHHYVEKIEDLRQKEVSWALEKLTSRSEQIGQDLFQAEADLATFIRSIDSDDSATLERLQMEIAKLSTILGVISTGPATEDQKEQVAIKLAAAETELQDWTKAGLLLERKKRLVEQLQTSYLQTLEKLDEFQAFLSATNGKTRRASSAIVNRNAIWPNIPVALALSGVAAFTMSVVLALLLESMNRRIKTEQQAAQIAHLPSLGYLSRSKAKGTFRRKRPKSGTLPPNPGLSLNSSFRHGLMRRHNVNDDPAFLMVTSGLPDEGKSTVTKSLAIAALSERLRVLVVDIDSHRWGVSKSLGAQKGSTNLREFSARKMNVEEFDMGKAFDGKLSLLRLNIRDACTGSEFRDSIEYFKASVFGYFDLVVLDTAPVLLIDDACRIGPFVDEAVVVYRFNTTTQDVLRNTVNRLRENGVKVAGTLMNDFNQRESLNLKLRNRPLRLSGKPDYGAI